MEMKNYIRKRAEKHKVTHSFSGQRHFFNVKSDSGQTHDVIIQAGCSCKYMAIQGLANGKLCSHIIAVYKEISDNGEIKK